MVNVQRPHLPTLNLERETLNRADGATLNFEPVFPLTALGLCYLTSSDGGVARAMAGTTSGICLASEITMI